MVGFFSTWRGSLEHFLGWFQDVRGRTRYFPLKAFLFFCAINLAFFWWALLTAYPAYVVGPKVEEYALMGFPVAVLGAVFDCLSLAGNALHCWTSPALDQQQQLSRLFECRCGDCRPRRLVGVVCLRGVRLAGELHPVVAGNHGLSQHPLSGAPRQPAECPVQH